MEDCFRNWSEKEKEAFFGALELQFDIKAFNLYIQNVNKVIFTQRLGRQSGSKVKILYYSGLLTVKKLCQQNGFSLQYTVPDCYFFQVTTIDLKSFSHKLLKRQFKRLSKNPSLLSVFSIQNCMKALSLAIKTKKQLSQKPVIGIKVIQSEQEIICQFCGKPRRMGRSFLFQGINECLALQLLPFRPYYHKALVRSGFNPRLQIYLPPNKLLAEIIEHLNNKWNPTYIENNNQEFVISLMAPWQGKFIEYNKSQEKITIGDVFLSLESPIPLQLYYYWKPIETSPAENQLTNSDHSVNSTSMLLFDDKSNSMHFLSTPNDYKPINVASPFKTLTRAHSHPFSRGEDDSQIFASPKEIFAENSLQDFRHDGEESMFSAFFSFK